MKFNTGQKVKLISTGEVGVIICSWLNDDLDCSEYYIAFIGTKFTSNMPENPPYVLKYLESSLESI